MAKILNKDPVIYQRERDGFIRDLKQFHETRGTPFRKIPKINGHEVDLYLLYVLVTAHGGWLKVNSRNEWDSLVEHFCLPKSCVNSAVALKQIYLRYLDRYEKLHYLGEDVDRGSDDDEESRHRRWSARALHSVPLSYNHNQHNVAEHLRNYNGLSTDLYKASGYERLALSLLSPLPNEQDFAINVCTLLSNEGKHTLRLDKCPRIIDFLLAHTGVFNHSSLRLLFEDVYGKIRKNSLRNFWLDTLADSDLSDFIDEEKFSKLTSKGEAFLEDTSKSDSEDQSDNKVKEGDVVASKVTNNVQSEPEIPKESVSGESKDSENEISREGDAEKRRKLEITDSDRELFCLGRSFGTQDYVGQRILQIGAILRNLTFHEENINVLARNSTFLRFLLLCAGSRWSCLHQQGFDMLGNVATEIQLEDPAADRLTTGLLTTVSRGLTASDRYVVLACLEVLNKLSQKEENEDIMLRCLDQQVYDQICSFLTLHDIMLLIYTLECLYSLSSLGERACNSIVRVHGAIDTLVSLITVEAQSYGPKACILMRVVETVPGAAAMGSNTSATPQTTPAPTTSTSQPTIQRQVTAQRIVVGAPQPAVATPVVQFQPQAIQQQTLQQQQQQANQQAVQENEQFALAWLRATYELASGHRIEQAEMYKQYLTACAKVGRRGVIAPLHFPRCVRSVFGSGLCMTAQKPIVLGPGGTVPVAEMTFYEGIKVRANSIPVTAAATVVQHAVATVWKPQAQIVTKTVTPPPAAPTPPPPSPLSTDMVDPSVPAPASPILKAQLSAPPKQREAGKADNKSQVTQRQQQQRLLQQQLQKDSTSPPKTSPSPSPTPTINVNKTPDLRQRTSRINGARTPVQLQTDNVKEIIMETNEAGSNSSLRGRREPPQPPPPPLSSSSKLAKLEIEDSDSTGNNSLASSSGLGGSRDCISINVPEDGENSLTSFEGILNGIPHLDIDAASNDSSSKDSARSGTPQKSANTKSLMLADLLEKKVDKKDPPVINGVVGKELRIGEKGLELVENHLEKVLKDSGISGDVQAKILVGIGGEIIGDERTDAQDLLKTLTEYNALGTEGNDEQLKLVTHGVKRAAENEPTEEGLVEAKRIHLSESSVNGVASPSLTVEGTSTSEEASVDPVSDSGVGSSDNGSFPSPSAANLYAAIAASALEDEPDLEPPPPQVPGGIQLVQGGLRQVFLGDGSQQQQQLIVTNAPRQIIASQGQVLITAGGQIALQQTPTKSPVLTSASRGAQVVLSQGGSGQLILSQTPGQYVSAIVAQPQTALVQGQTQTVLVAQTPQQQGTSAKTIIILQPQNTASTPTHQKVVMTPQGQQVVVTQVPRPIIQSPAIPNVTPPALVPTTNAPTALSNNPSNQQIKIVNSVSSPSAINHNSRPVQSVSGPPSRPETPNSNAVTSGTATTPTSNKVVTTKTSVPHPSPSASPMLPPSPQSPASPAAKPVTRMASTPSRTQSPVTLPSTSEINDKKNSLSKVPTSNASGPQLRSQSTPNVDSSMFLCEWRGCMRSFKSANEVYMHACESHCPSGSEEIQCLWERCDGMKRKRFSLMTHLYDRHCNAEVLRMMAMRRKQLSQSGKSEIPPPQPPPPHPGYAPNAAFHAIKRHALEFVNPKEMMDDNEGPVTKSIRLTASLILRNLVIYSTNGRRFLRSYEPHLASVALSNVESSRTIAQVLYDMNQQASRR